jgi:hypothetical protein
MKNLLSMARGFAVHLHSRVMSYVASEREKRAFSELPLLVRPLNISPKAITTKGITSGRSRRFLKWPGVEVWPVPHLGTSTTAGVNSTSRRRTRSNENALRRGGGGFINIFC